MYLNTAFRLLAVSLMAASSAQAACPSLTTGTLNVPCTASSLTAALVSAGCEEADLPTNEIIDEACKDGATNFGDISNLHYQFDKTYMDGGTIWNDGPQEESEVDQARITRALSSVGTGSQINWPEYEALEQYSAPNAPYMSNFNLTSSCQLNTVMCCFTEDKDDFEEIPDNSEVCAHDIHDSLRSTHVRQGHVAYDDNVDTYCTGFTWSDGDASDRFKGNSLLDISFRNTVEKGYAKNIPGAPMCACIEQMPTVTRADCRTTAVANEAVTFSFVEGEFQVDSITADVTFEDCSTNDLKANALSENSIDLSTELVDTKEGCDAAKVELLNEKFWVPLEGTQDIYEDIAETEWEQVAGKGLRFWPLSLSLADDDVEFRAALGEPPFLIRRYCDSCKSSHRDIYYKRFTALPAAEDQNFLDVFLSNWVNTNNTMGVDFNLYSNLADAEAGTATEDANAWTYCNYNHGSVGFPRDCGPTGYVGCQWNSFKRGICGGEAPRDFSFYIQTPTLTPQ